MNIAHLNQIVHIATAVMGGVALGMSGLGLAYGTKAGSEFVHGKANVPGTNEQGLLHAFDRGSIFGQMGGSINTMGSNATQASQDLNIAYQEGLKEMQNAYSQLARAQMDKGNEAVKTSDDQIQQLLQTLQKIRDGLEQALKAITGAR
jgi:hypothetical protein